MMPVTMRTRCSLVAEIICTYSPTSIAASPVPVVMMCTAATRFGTFLTIMPRTKDASPATSVKMVRMFTTGWRCPSEFRMFWGGPLRTVPARVTTSLMRASIRFTAQSSPCRTQEYHRSRFGRRPRSPVTGEQAGVATLSPLRVIRPLFASARDRDTSCHGKTVAALVQRRLRTPMRHYEVLIILDPNLEERTVQPSIDQFLKVVTTGGGKVDKVDIWGKRRLAYQIEKKSEGIYAVVDLTAEPGTVQELDRQLNLNEAVLRTKVMRPEHRH